MRFLWIALWLGISSIAHADTSYGYHMVVTDKNDGTPIEGVEISFEFTDMKKDYSKSKVNCITDKQGKCSSIVSVYSSFFVGSSVNARYTFKKDGYSPVFSPIKNKKIDNENMEIYVSLDSLESQKQKNVAAQIWGLDEGPKLSEKISSKPRTLVDIFTNGKVDATLSRGKFETEGDFKKRSLNAGATLVVMPVPLVDSHYCLSSFDHKLSVYRVEGCSIFPANGLVQVLHDDSDSIVLSNAFDSRRIKVLKTISIFLKGEVGTTWSADYQLTPKDAEALELDLMAGVEVEDFEISKSCSKCDTRKTNDNINNVIGTLGDIVGKNTTVTDTWQNRAFKSGAIEENWVNSLTLVKVKRYFIYRRSDEKLLYELVVSK